MSFTKHLPAPTLSVLMYHEVGEFPSRPASHRALFCDVRRFRNQMRFLRTAGFQVVSLAQAWAGLFGNLPLPRRPVVLTFDDGYANFATHAWPVLQEFGYPASVFLVVDQLGGYARWLDESFLPVRLMDSATVRRLHAQGVDFGSHTSSHVRLSGLPDDQLRREIHGSKAALEDLLDAEVPHFCYPYGDYDRRARDASADAGYRLALTCIRGAANYAANAHELPRKAISWGDNLAGLAWKLLAKQAPKGQGMRGEGGAG